MNPYEQYRQQVVSTMTQGDMLLKLYDEVTRQIELARIAIATGKIQEMDTAIKKAQRIIQYLRSCLNMKYPVSNNLYNLYSFFETQLVSASIKKDVKSLDDIEPLIQELRDTFNQCAKQDRVVRGAGITADVV